MFKKIFAGTALLLACCMAHASLIEYNGYSRDSSSNIVIGGGLEWLMWDVTKGMSINAALSAFENDGWILASNEQMANLFNVFEFGKTDWNDAETVMQGVSVPWNPLETGPWVTFINLFGITSEDSCSLNGLIAGCVSDFDRFIVADAFYGSDLNANDRFKRAVVWDDYSRISAIGVTEVFGARAELHGDYYTRDGAGASIGVALVRNAVILPDINQVPVPASISLMLIGVAGLAFRHRLLNSDITHKNYDR